MIPVSKRILALILCFLLLSTLLSCKNEENFSNTYLEYFDTVTTFTVANVPKETYEEAEKIVLSDLEKYHRLFDIYNLYDGLNNIKSINDSAGMTAVSVSDELIQFLEYCTRLHAMTSGYFNIALGSVLVLWHDCREASKEFPDNAKIPDRVALENASLHTDIEDIVIDKVNKTVFLRDSEMSLDVGAIAKGYAAQKIYDKLKSLGYTDFVLSIGGNIVVSGKKSDSSPWRIGIEDPLDTTKTVCSLSFSDRSLVTSGSYQRYYTVGDKKYHHIVDPYSLMPENNYLSVSVLHEDSAFADAMSTALFNMPYEIGAELVKNTDGLEAMWVLSDGSVIYSDNFSNYINS